MNECVVRMEMPSKDRICQMADDIDGVWYCPVMKKLCRQPDNGEMPLWCPIICSLPEGHGRLGDLDELAAGCDDPYWCRWLSEIEDAPTIVPAEAERSET